ncbi:hypothetical protein V8F20_003259 [Naviculisporaceae sp. PSN 640]
MGCFSCFSSSKPNNGHKNGKYNTLGGGGGGAHKQDPVDKAVSGMLGNRIKPETVEKITDGARGMFEKKTGHKVPGFISN